MSRSNRAAIATALMLATSVQAQAAPRAPGSRPAHASVEAGIWDLVGKLETETKRSGELNTDPKLNAYIREVGCRVAKEYCEELRFYVLDRPIFNASMAPMPSVRVGQTEIPYELRRSAAISERRITVTPGHVEVLALASDDEVAVEGFLQRKRQWLFDTLREMDEALAKRPVVPRFMTGSKIPFRGRQWSLTVRRHDGPHIEIAHRNGFVVDLPAWVAEEAVEAVAATEIKLWLKRRVRLDAHEIAAAYDKRFGLKPRAIRVAEFVTGWGSCTPGGTIHIDWRLVFAPKRVLEYVVVHELAHLKHRTHGEEFWEFLGSILPDFERPRGWLALHQSGLDASFLIVGAR